jgi:hypothetical protein
MLRHNPHAFQNRWKSLEFAKAIKMAIAVKIIQPAPDVSRFVKKSKANKPLQFPGCVFPVKCDIGNLD